MHHLPTPVTADFHPLQVSPSAQLYLREVESREEGGTPGIVGSIRVGLAMQLKQAVGVGTIAQREEKLTRLAATGTAGTRS